MVISTFKLIVQAGGCCPPPTNESNRSMKHGVFTVSLPWLFIGWILEMQAIMLPAADDHTVGGSAGEVMRVGHADAWKYVGLKKNGSPLNAFRRPPHLWLSQPRASISASVPVTWSAARHTRVSKGVSRIHSLNCNWSMKHGVFTVSLPWLFNGWIGLKMQNVMLAAAEDHTVGGSAGEVMRLAHADAWKYVGLQKSGPP